MARRVNCKINVLPGKIEHSLKTFKNKLQRDLIFRRFKETRFYEPPTTKRRRKAQEAARRKYKQMRMRDEE